MGIFQQAEATDHNVRLGLVLEQLNSQKVHRYSRLDEGILQVVRRPTASVRVLGFFLKGGIDAMRKFKATNGSKMKREIFSNVPRTGFLSR